MSIDKINGNLRTTSTGKFAGKASTVETEDESPQSVAASFDVTKATKALKQALAETGTEPVMDTARIEAVRRQLEEGTYAVDAEKIAEKMIQFEQDLPSGTEL